MSQPSPDPPRPKPIPFRDLSKGWRLTLLIEWACLAWIALSMAFVWINHRTGWPYPAVQYATFYRALEVMLTRSMMALWPATILHIACLGRPRVRFPLGWVGRILAIVWIIVLSFASMPVF